MDPESATMGSGAYLVPVEHRASHGPGHRALEFRWQAAAGITFRTYTQHGRGRSDNGESRSDGILDRTRNQPNEVESVCGYGETTEESQYLR